MSYCNCKDVEWFDVFFGIFVFSTIMFVVGENLMILFVQTEWYRALGVTLGMLTVAGTVGVVSSLSAQWMVKNIVLVLVILGSLWAYSLTI